MTATRHTLVREISVSGIALHAGVEVEMTLLPAPAGSGIVFRRADCGMAEIPARYDLVGDTRLGTTLSSGDARVGVIEHLMAAIAGAEVDDLAVVLDGPEPPILDGSALGYLDLIAQAGIRDVPGERKTIEVLRRVEARQGEASAALEPAPGLGFDFEIDFPTPAIGRQSCHFIFSQEAFRHEIAPARTFGFVRELETLHRMGLARGASLENTLALTETGVMNADKMRFVDEFVRHKVLDAVGDLKLAGAPLQARFTGVRSGHALNNALLKSLFADSANYHLVSIP
jgi:UDP-3-O-[3-hydroxymyristoyl] N-acetylglucosamine deacetylase